MGITELPNYDPHLVVAVDYDGTLTDFETDTLIPQRIEDVKELQKQGVRIVLWTCREGEELEEKVTKLAKSGFVPDYINEYPLRGDSRKINADFYIDDRCCPELDWNKIMDFLKSEVESGKYVLCE